MSVAEEQFVIEPGLVILIFKGVTDNVMTLLFAVQPVVFVKVTE